MYDLDKTHLKVRMNLPGVHQTQLPLTCFICLIFTIKAIQDHRAGQWRMQSDNRQKQYSEAITRKCSV